MSLQTFLKQCYAERISSGTFCLFKPIIMLDKYWQYRNFGCFKAQKLRPAADFTKLYATAEVHLCSGNGATCAINVAQVDLRTCVNFHEISGRSGVSSLRGQGHFHFAKGTSKSYGQLENIWAQFYRAAKHKNLFSMKFLP